MAFVEIEQAEITEGAPVTMNLFQKIKDNFDAHQAEIVALHKKTIVMSLIFGG